MSLTPKSTLRTDLIRTIIFTVFIHHRRFHDWQDYLDEWGEKNDTGQAPNFTPNLPNPDDIKPAPSGEDQISKDLPKNPALLSIEPFENWSFIDIYNAMHGASSITDIDEGRGKNIGDAWRDVNRNISDDRNQYDDAIKQSRTRAGGRAKRTMPYGTTSSSICPKSIICTTL